MATGNTTLLGLALPVEGELDGTWGDVVNDSITSLVDSAIAGTTTLSTDADATLTDTNLAANQARQAVLLWTASNGATTRNITAPARSKPYIVINAGTGSIVLRGAGPTAGVTIVAGEKCLAAWNGSDFVKIATSTADGVTSVGGTGTVNGITLTGTVTSTGNLTLGGTLSNVNLTSQVTGTLPVANGGTGITSFGAGVATFLGTPSSANLAAAVTDETGSGALVFATSPTLVTPALGTPASGVLTNATGLPLSTGVTGTLPVANGGTGATSLTANNVLLGNGTSAVQVVAPGTSGNVLTSNGTTWTSAPAGASLSGQTDSASPFETSLGSGAGAVNTGVNNTFVGFEAGNDNTTGTDNTFIGFKAADAGTGLSDLVAIGSNAAGAGTGGGNSVVIGSRAASAITSFTDTVAIGYQTMLLRTGGTSNVAIGADAMGAGVDSGSSNVAIGNSALVSASSDSNVAVGRYALAALTSGGSNVGVGYAAGIAITTGQQNTTIGTNAAYSGINNLTTGSNNIIIGYNAAASSATVSNEVTIGNTSITSTRLRGMVELNAAMFEAATISATAATGTINFDARTQSVLYYTSNASGNWTLNIRAASGVSLDSVMTTGESMTVAFLVTNGATAYYQTGFQVDGSSVTPKWQGGTAPAAGNASSIDTYVITVIKTGTATFTVLASQTKFA